ncbi:hypothetical protein GSI_04328 [Ganoderma sinense ZZ0214-1]|uniref:rRNA-processing protein EFG1 n=1 Tax=Ganoderma sinense ZZ0214-1 TaxID=1077348 RepID=A0A2G8SIV1_9APHY|nr:hypothetical protein GSI_04328 [Ganoderma sinense ZZ0214-1]
MGPPRNTTTSDPSSSKHPASAPKKKSANRPQHKKHPHPSSASSSNANNSNPNSVPGVQNIKAALRQTRRLLAKDRLAADVRVATERRLKALEGDLARAEAARVERTLATRYHKVKFFERQKILRKLAQAKRQLAEGQGEDGEALGKKERRKLEKMVAGLRVDLNYVLHYPKTKKYISLFPPEARKGRVGEGEGDDDEEMDENEEKGKAETDRQREEVRTWVREQMEAGALSAEPEIEVGKTEGGKSAPKAKLLRPPSLSAHAQRREDSSKLKPSTKPAQGGVADDDFFGADEDDEGEEGGTSEGDEHSEMDED